MILKFKQHHNLVIIVGCILHELHTFLEKMGTKLIIHPS